MGIPSYFKKIIDDFPKVIQTDKSNSIIFDQIYLDFNCCIHGCSNDIKTEIINQDILSPSDFEKLLIQRVLNYITKIITYIKNTTELKLFYISIDGVPPRSKMVQQRNRRYMSAWKKQKLIRMMEKNQSARNSTIPYIINCVKNEWDSSAISPGTVFMKKLSIAIQEQIEQCLIPKYPHTKFTLSDSLEPGEGEFKIYQEIKRIRSSNESSKILIYGLDADLIMLSLINQYHDHDHELTDDIYLLREPLYLKMQYPDEFIFVSITELTTSIYATYSKDMSNCHTQRDLIENYVAICFMLGNDFVPHISFLNFKEEGLETLIQTYKNVSNNRVSGDNLLNQSNNSKTRSINYPFLSDIITSLAKMEDQKIINHVVNYNKKKPFIRKIEFKSNKDVLNFYLDKLERFPIFTNSKAMENNHPQQHSNNNNGLVTSSTLSSKIKPGLDGWHQRYYYHLFDTILGKEIQSICRCYLESLQFTLDYYFHGKYHHTWYYQYNYGPTLLDLSNSLMNIVVETTDTTKPSNPITIQNCDKYPDMKISIPLQLMMILPIASNHLIINSDHRKMMSDTLSGVRHYYPDEFQMEMYLKEWLWMCHPRLPEIDIKYLNSKLNQIS